MGRPTTRWVAPRRTASAAVTVRTWSPLESPAARMPGTTIHGAGPRAPRISVTSRPDTTTPRRPAPTANRARRSVSTPRSGTPRPTTCSYSPASCEVSTVTPTRSMSPAARAAAASAAGPARAWTVAIVTPCARAASTAPATTLGISCHLRSRNTRIPRAPNSRTSAGPSRTWRTGPIFAHRSPGRRAARSSASRPFGRSNATMKSVTRELLRNPFGYPRVRERRGPNRDERCAGRQVLARVARGPDTADPDDRNVDGFTYFSRCQHADRKERRTAQAARTVSEARVEGPRNGIHEGHRGSTFLLRHVGHAGDVRQHGRELHCDRFGSRGATAPHQLAQPLGGRPELEPPGAGVWAGRVDLECRDHGQTGKTRDHARVVIDRRTGHVDQHPRAPQVRRQPRKLAFAHGLEPGVREPDRVEHAPRELRHARGAMSLPWLRGHRLGDDPAERVQIDHSAHLVAEAGGAGSEKDWILEGRVEQPNRRHRPLAGAATASLRSNSRRYATMPSAIALAILC